MPPYPTPTKLFHITAIDNLRSIAEAGELVSKNRAIASNVATANIAYQSVQGHRAVRAVNVGRGGVVHDYVPFYFAPRSPMLFTINNGNVPGCAYRQDDIVHIASSIERIRQLGLDYVFSNANAATALASFFSSLDDLEEVDWGLICEPPRLEGYCRYWQNNLGNPRYVQRMEKRMAEFLVHCGVPIAAVIEVGVRTSQMADRVSAALKGAAWAPEIRVVPGWYY
ncbi:hypothetical protein ARD30_21010 [Bosea thiooxidans]|uniref:DarT domain-containing protein n=1 Tax=Bosea thiooxidans TaxID=53254 RepID=A0A0Q3KFS1_9HYPH|nr:hypothetical protein ARD30_21010 [Bosea thiooxidans]